MPRRRFFIDFEDEEELEHEFGEAISLNPFRTTYYLGRGRFGDNSRLHRGLMIFREREEIEPGILAIGDYYGWRSHRRRDWRRHGRREYERRR